MTYPRIKPRDLVPLVNAGMSVDYSANRCTAPVYADFQQALLSGHMPFVVREYIKTTTRIKDMTALLLEDYHVTRRSMQGQKNWGEVVLAVRNDERVTMLVERLQSYVEISVAGIDMEEARQALIEMSAKIPVTKLPDDTVDAWIWHLSHQGPSSSVKKLTAPSWDEISDNYVSNVSSALGRMVDYERPEGNGKIILWHGPPGTGKTTALRMLAREWKGWCDFHYVADPEKFFAEPSYLLEVGTTDNGNGQVTLDELEGEAEQFDADDKEDAERTRRAKMPKWRLVVAEDSDEFLRRNSRDAAGASLGRLLNFSDGILGQGSNTLILLTTNTDLDELDPALVRPGRCLNQVFFKKFSPEEGYAWRTKKQMHSRPNRDMTLAELIEDYNKIHLVGNDGVERIATGLDHDVAVGQYL